MEQTPMMGLGVGSAPPAPAAAAMPVAPAPGNVQPAGDPMGFEGTPASPEEQELYDKTVAAAQIAVYDKKVAPQLVEMMRSSAENPVEAIAEISSMLAMRIYGTAQEEGTSIPGDVMLHAGKEIVEAVVELAEASGIPISDGDEEMAYYVAVDRFRSMAQEQGLYTDEAFAEDTATLGQLGQQGKLAPVQDMIARAQGGAPQAPAPAAPPAAPMPGAV